MLNPIDSYKELESLVGNSSASFYSLGKELKFSSSFFSEWKRGKMMPKLDKLLLLAEHFKVPLQYFINDDEED